MNNVDEQFESLNVTEYNSNKMTVYRIHQYLSNFNRCMSMREFITALQQLEMFYAEINPKLMELKKTKELDNIESYVKKSRNHVFRKSHGPADILNCQKYLIESLRALMIGTNAIGLGLTKKSDGLGGMAV